ncbi:MAG: glutamate--tRNA ligase, partial [Acidobacteriota bacterium]
DLEQRLLDLATTLARVEPFDELTTEAALRTLAAEMGNGAGKYIHPLRVALTGKSASPPIFDVAVALGKERTLRRLRRLIDSIPKLTSP